jgi:replicative DNA helicase
LGHDSARKNSDSAIEIDGLTGGRDRQECEPPPKSISPAESPQVRVARSDNGFEVTLDELMRTGEHPPLWSVDERMRLRRRRETGRVLIRSPEVIRLTLLSGRELELTAGQQALKLDGWKSIADLSNGDRIDVLRRLSEPAQTRRMHDSEVIMLAHMIGDGSCIKRQPVRYASIMRPTWWR